MVLELETPQLVYCILEHLYTRLADENKLWKNTALVV